MTLGGIRMWSHVLSDIGLIAIVRQIVRRLAVGITDATGDNVAFKFKCGDTVVARHDIPKILETQEQLDFLNQVGTVTAYQLGGYMLVYFEEACRRLLVNEKYYELWTEENTQ